MLDDDDNRYDGEPDPQELPEVVPEQPGPCYVCGKPEQRNGCFKCGKPVCYNEQDYLGDSQCGGWILDSWHPDAPEENEFWYQHCLKEGLDEAESSTEELPSDEQLVLVGGGSFIDDESPY